MTGFFICLVCMFIFDYAIKKWENKERFTGFTILSFAYVLMLASYMMSKPDANPYTGLWVNALIFIVWYFINKLFQKKV